MYVYEIETWKTAQISALTIAINNAITNNVAPLQGWAGNEAVAINGVTALVNSLSFTRSPSGTDDLNIDVLKTQLLSIYSYISMKYLSIFEDTSLETKYLIPALIPAGTYPENDFRNVLGDFNTLPELTLSYFNFYIEADPITYNVVPNPIFSNITSVTFDGYKQSELTFFNSLPTATNSGVMKDKVLYMSFNKPTMKRLDPAPEPKTILLDTMHFKDAIIRTQFKDGLIDIFPELA